MAELVGEDDRPIAINEDIWHYLSPFSAHQIDIWGERFATVEHAYHCARFVPGPAREALKAATSPLACLRLSRALRADASVLVPDFDKAAVMEELFRAKLAQHPEVAEVLALTGERLLLKNITTDAFWGLGPDGRGENRMGQLWMRLRGEKGG
jgi:ribA/ribD-fused uncharacterized protein